MFCFKVRASFWNKFVGTSSDEAKVLSLEGGQGLVITLLLESTLCRKKGGLREGRRERQKAGGKKHLI